ncbi:transcriptional regulator containing an amidase domain and an AraC-type DNA-binding HTH domain [Opitutaceae bacterium TAV1]|nr:transcriptional regulator containing an amidase domain and an AraC-type DNA-binding HTH domain [Opitutaceae bacterium TAV1]
MQLTRTESFCDVIERLEVDRGQCPPLRNLGLLNVGITHASGNWCFIRPEPGFGLVIATISGAGRVACSESWQEAEWETAYIMPPGVAHGYRVSPRSGEWKYAWAKFETTEKYPELFQDARPVLIPAASYALEAANRGLFTEVTRGNSPQLAGIWCDLVRASLTALTNRRALDPRIEKLWEVVAQRLEEDWVVETLAAEAHVGREHLRRLCQRHYGCSPRHRLTRLRLRKSCELLLLTDTTLDVIAERVGFSDAFSLSKAFAREYGMPPSRYREKARTSARESGMV